MDKGQVEVRQVYFVNIFLEKNAVLPAMQHSGDAGFDLVAASEPKIVGLEDPDNEGFYFKIDYIEYDTGIRLAPPEKLFSKVLPRSSISKKNLALANSVGLIDTGYRDTIKVRFKYVAQPWDYEISVSSVASSGLATQDLTVDTKVDVAVEKITVSVDADKIYQKGERIGQLVFYEHSDAMLCQIDDRDNFFANISSRGEGGFGSTGD